MSNIKQYAADKAALTAWNTVNEMKRDARKCNQHAGIQLPVYKFMALCKQDACFRKLEQNMHLHAHRV
jgi:hypothetical protein